MKDYDFIIAGAGCAGLSLVYHLSKTLPTAKILILDAHDLGEKEKTWCYWSETPLDLPCNIHTYWNQVEFIGPDQKIQKQSINPLRYYCVKSSDFFSSMRRLLFSHPSYTFLQSNVLSVCDVQDGVVVNTTKGTFHARLVFNSLPEAISPDIRRFHFGLQHFTGWNIHTDKPVFDEGIARLMDFNIPQDGRVQFVYVLPYTRYSALVEFTVFSPNLLPFSEYETKLAHYISDNLGVKNYKVESKEFGAIPMTDYTFSPQPGKYIHNIGTRGGMTKSTTGYTFKNIQEDSILIAQSLAKGLPQVERKSKSLRFAFYDRLLLSILGKNPEKIPYIFAKLFSGLPHHKILKFLGENTDIADEMGIFMRLPWAPFLQACLTQMPFPMHQTIVNLPPIQKSYAT